MASTLASILSCCADPPQAFRYLLDLPIELRQQIYTFYLDSLPLTYPDLFPSLLLASHQLHEEASVTWRLSWPTVHFKFGGIRHLLRFLTRIKHPTLCKLRHVSVINLPLDLSPDSSNLFNIWFDPPESPKPFANGYERPRHIFDLHDLLPLFPGLQLSTLTIYDPFYGYQGAYHQETACHALGGLVRSQGWKELLYLVRHDWPSSPADSHGLPQPSTWDALIKQRDGTCSGAGVQIFGIDTAKRRTSMSCTFPTDGQEPSDGDQRYEHVEVQLTRGRGVDFVQERGKCNAAIEYLFQYYSWK